MFRVGFFFAALRDVRRRLKGEVQVKVQCHGCGAGITIPDDKVPGGRGFRIPCPKCKTMIAVEVSEKPVETAPADPLGFGAVSDLSDYTNAIDVVEDGVRTALLCVSVQKRADRIAQALQELDFWVVHAARAGFALGKIHHNHYDLIILEESFDAADAAENLVLHHIQLLPMHVRRQFYVCLLSETHPTLDAMRAFRMGVNLIVNVQDLEKAKIILARSMKEHKTFYSFFNSELNRKQA